MASLQTLRNEPALTGPWIERCAERGTGRREKRALGEMIGGQVPKYLKAGLKSNAGGKGAAPALFQA